MKLIPEQVRPGHRNDLSCSALRAKSHLYPLILHCNPLWNSLNCRAFKSWGSGTDTEKWEKTAKAKWGSDQLCCLSEEWDVTKKGGRWKWQELLWKKAFESSLVDHCFHLSDFSLCITKSPADCRHCLGFGACHSRTQRQCWVGLQSTQTLDWSWLLPV